MNDDFLDWDKEFEDDGSGGNDNGTNSGSNQRNSDDHNSSNSGSNNSNTNNSGYSNTGSNKSNSSGYGSSESSVGGYGNKNYTPKKPVVERALAILVPKEAPRDLMNFIKAIGSKCESMDITVRYVMGSRHDPYTNKALQSVNVTKERISPWRGYSDEKDGEPVEYDVNPTTYLKGLIKLIDPTLKNEEAKWKICIGAQYLSMILGKFGNTPAFTLITWSPEGATHIRDKERNGEHKFCESYKALGIANKYGVNVINLANRTAKEELKNLLGSME